MSHPVDRVCLSCGKEFDTPHGKAVHRGMKHPNEEESPYVELRVQLAKAGVKLEDVLEKLTGESVISTKTWTRTSDVKILAGLVETSGDRLRTEIEDRLPPGYYPDTAERVDYYQ